MTTAQRFYFSLQYSAIQKTILRHDRLWSMAGISQQLSRLNEIELPAIAKKHDADALIIVAGGGKFTARFTGETAAAQAREEIIRTIATQFPMQEFQAAEVVKASTFKDAFTKVRESLADEKRSFRGYATSFLPHLAVCGECGEYPAERDFKSDKDAPLCRTCHGVRQKVWINLAALKGEGDGSGTRRNTLERIYAGYLGKADVPGNCKLALDFGDLFPEGPGSGNDDRRRMAVWFSDLNNMNHKVPIWLSQPEDNIPEIFRKVTRANISVIVNALSETFPSVRGEYLPFRLVVAGGDDLCLVMPEANVLAFAESLDKAITDTSRVIDAESDNPLSTTWLQSHPLPREGAGDASPADPLKPYSFGGAFIITSLHTPFRRIHEVGEDLMKRAKKETDRLGNSINWRIMAEDAAVSETILDFERPLFIAEPSSVPKNWDDRLTFSEYRMLRNAFRTMSSSHRFAVVERLIRHRGNPSQLETALKKLDGATRSKSFSGLLTDEKLRRGGEIVPSRIATLLELLCINTGEVKP